MGVGPQTSLYRTSRGLSQVIDEIPIESLWLLLHKQELK